MSLGHRWLLIGDQKQLPPYMYNDVANTVSDLLDEIQDQKVALIAGGGNEIDIIQEIIDLGINIYETGITAINEYSQKTHEFEKEKGINLIGGTHYSTEKFACIALCRYFEKLGLNCEFIEDYPVIEDIE